MATRDNPTVQQPTEDEIRLRAYGIYLARAGREGDELADWLQAEAELTTPAVIRLQKAA
jgi:hypothetical protein